MTELTIFLATSCVGLFLGLAYGIFFMFLQKKVLELEQPSTFQVVFYSLFTAFIRIGFLVCAWLYLLHLPTIHSIILLFTFILMFLLVIFNK